MLRYSLIAVVLLLVAGAIVWLTVPSLTIFNTIVPKDSGSERVARDLSFGPDERQAIDIYAPRGAAAGDNRPVIIFYHGGGWHSGYRQGYSWAGRALAAQGFVTVVAGYRLAPDVRWPAFQEDATAAFRRARQEVARFGGDPDRIFLAGHSAGAQIAALLAMDESWLGQARSAVAGWVGVAGPYDFLPLDSRNTIAAFGEADDLDATQPISFVGEGDPPALLLHGAIDDTVKPRQSARLARLLEEANVRVVHTAYEGIGHINIITALSRWGRGTPPILDDIANFVRETSDNNGEPSA